MENEGKVLLVRNRLKFDMFEFISYLKLVKLDGLILIKFLKSFWWGISGNVKIEFGKCVVKVFFL